MTRMVGESDRLHSARLREREADRREALKTGALLGFSVSALFFALVIWLWALPIVEQSLAIVSAAS